MTNSLIFHFFFFVPSLFIFFPFFIFLGGGGGGGVISINLGHKGGGEMKKISYEEGVIIYLLQDLGATRRIPPAPSPTLKMNGHMICTSNADTGKLSG